MSQQRLIRWLLLLQLLVLAGCAVDSGRESRLAASEYANLGADYLRKGHNDQARQAFLEALHRDGDNFKANWGMAVVDQLLHHPDQAVGYFQKALRVRTDEPAVHNGYAALLCEQGQVDHALRHFDRAQRRQASHRRADTLANAGLCLYRAGRFETADDYFRRALQDDANQGTALTQLARLAWQRADYPNARAFIERADEATELSADTVLLAARIEQALGNAESAAGYLARYNVLCPEQKRSLHELTRLLD